MLVKDIKALPTIFYFKSNINPLNIIYKAEKCRGFYGVTCAEDNVGYWIYSKDDMHEKLRNDDYIVVPKPDYIEDEIIEEEI
jgi:hypothetical protein